MIPRRLDRHLQTMERSDEEAEIEVSEITHSTTIDDLVGSYGLIATTSKSKEHGLLKVETTLVIVFITCTTHEADTSINCDNIITTMSSITIVIAMLVETCHELIARLYEDSRIVVELVQELGSRRQTIHGIIILVLTDSIFLTLHTKFDTSSKVNLKLLAMSILTI